MRKLRLNVGDRPPNLSAKKGQRLPDTSQKERAELLHSLAERVLRFARKGDGKAGLGPAQVSALGMLREQGDMSIKALADAEGVAHATMSRMVSMLEKSGAIVKARDATDARKQVVALTQHGRDVEREARARRQKLIDELVGLLRVETVDELIIVMRKLSRWQGNAD